MLYKPSVPLPPSNITTFSIQGPTTGTSNTQTANNLYVGTIQIPVACTLTGICFYNGSTINGNVLVALYNSAGTQVAHSASTAQSGSFGVQSVPFTSTYAAAAGEYFISVMPSSSTADFALVCAFGPSADYAQGTFTLPSTITPPTNNGAYVIAAGTY